MFKFENGEIVKDAITDLEGVVMARVNYLTGCNQYGISTRKLTSEGKRPDWEYVDENRLISLKKSVELPVIDETYKAKGFDGNLPSRKS